MTFLVDGNVLSEATKPAPDIQVIDWLRRHERELAVDAIILGEIHFGILLLPRGRRRQLLEQWFDQGIRRLRCLSWESAVGLRWSRLLADLRSHGHAMPIKDSMIAATALHHGLTLATHNTRHFVHAGVQTVDPFG